MLAAAEIPSIVPVWVFWWLVPLVVVIAVLGVLTSKQPEGKRRKGQAGAEPRLFVARERLLSEREIRFFRVLEPLAAEGGFRVCPQVRLGDVLQSDGRAANAFGTRQTIRGMHLDFVLVEAESFRIHAGIELQDSTHRAKKRRNADETKAQAMEAAGVPLLIYESARDLHQRGLQSG